MKGSRHAVTVYYGGACPRCVRDRARYERLSANTGESAQWVDITGRDAELCQLGIDPQAALQELHVRDSAGAIHRELEAYILLMSRVPTLRPLAWLIGLTGVRPVVSWLYRTCVLRRLRATNRL
jgi:predicted DCC family thiol-disulfide oxidoreductase YuxK